MSSLFVGTKSRPKFKTSIGCKCRYGYH